MIDEDKIGKQEFQEVSEAPIFNLIGAYAQTKGYKPVYFKASMPAWDRDLRIFSLKYMQYIHLWLVKLT